MRAGRVTGDHRQDGETRQVLGPRRHPGDGVDHHDEQHSGQQADDRADQQVRDRIRARRGAGHRRRAVDGDGRPAAVPRPRPRPRPRRSGGGGGGGLGELCRHDVGQQGGALRIEGGDGQGDDVAVRRGTRADHARQPGGRQRQAELADRRPRDRETGREREVGPGGPGIRARRTGRDQDLRRRHVLLGRAHRDQQCDQCAQQQRRGHRDPAVAQQAKVTTETARCASPGQGRSELTDAGPGVSVASCVAVGRCLVETAMSRSPGGGGRRGELLCYMRGGARPANGTAHDGTTNRVGGGRDK